MIVEWKLKINLTMLKGNLVNNEALALLGTDIDFERVDLWITTLFSIGSGHVTLTVRWNASQRLFSSLFHINLRYGSVN